MNGDESSDALSSLRRLKDNAGGLIAEAIAPVDEAIREIGVSFRASHYAEDCRDWDPDGYGYYQAHAGRFVFAIEVAEGNVSEYCLCAAQGPDGNHGLYVSVCDYHVEDEERKAEGGETEVIHRAVIDRIYLVRPETLSLSLRAQMLDELSQGNFLRAYRHYVEQGPEERPEDGVFRYWLPKKKA